MFLKIQDIEQVLRAITWTTNKLRETKWEWLQFFQKGIKCLQNGKKVGSITNSKNDSGKQLGGVPWRICGRMNLKTF